MGNTVLVVDQYEFEKLVRKINQIDAKLDALNLKSNDGFKDKWYVTEEVCRLINVSKRTLQKMRNSRAISFTQSGKKIYYKASDIEKYLETLNTN